MTDFSTDCLVIGAGVVGLAIARRLALSGRETILIEAEGAIGTGTSSRNSEVVHAGLYYPTGSLKARACVAGREALYDYCATRGVEVRRCGKLLVATSEDQRATLAAFRGPALVLLGEEDRLIPRERHDLLAALMPQAAAVRVPGAGHLPPLERPEATNAALAAWLAA